MRLERTKLDLGFVERARRVFRNAARRFAVFFELSGADRAELRKIRFFRNFFAVIGFCHTRNLLNHQKADAENRRQKSKC